MMGCMCPTPSRAACDRETRICARCLSCPQSKSTKRRELESARPGSEVHRRARARPGTRSGERASPAFNPRKPNAASAPTKGPFSPIKRELRSALLVHAPALQVHVHAFGALASDPTFAMARSVMCVYLLPLGPHTQVRISQPSWRKPNLKLKAGLRQRERRQALSKIRSSSF